MKGTAAALPQTAAVLDRFYLALEHGDLDAARACCSPRARFWHNFDAVAQDLEAASRGWAGMFSAFAEHRIADVRRREIPEGIVQRHLLLLCEADGTPRARPCCIFVAFEQGLISRIDEYLDLSSDLAVDAGGETTAGLAADGAFL